jgi:hypothetical protein
MILDVTRNVANGMHGQAFEPSMSTTNIRPLLLNLTKGSRSEAKHELWRPKANPKNTVRLPENKKKSLIRYVASRLPPLILAKANYQGGQSNILSARTHPSVIRRRLSGCILTII